MFLKHSIITLTAAALFAVVGSASGSAQENCSYRYQRLMEAYQTQSPRYGQMLNHYNARCLSGSAQPAWEGGHRHRYDNGRRWDDNGRRGYDNDRWRHGW
jgi:hypothetical protein